jgi:TolB-like protein
MLELYPDNESLHELLGFCYLGMSRFEDAVGELERAVELSGGREILNGYLAELALVLARSGNVSEAAKILQQFLQASLRRFIPCDLIGEIHFGLGHRDEAIRWFEKAYDEKNAPLVIQWLKNDPIFDELRSDLGYVALLKKVGLMSAEEAENEVRRIERTQTVLDKKRIAVLPFSNISPSPNDEYFAEGLTEEMISTLSNIRGLNVISRTSVLHYRNSPKTVREISRELSAGTLMEGSVRKSANKVRITIQLIDAVQDKHLWSQKYDRELGDVFSVQGDVAQHVARALRIESTKDTPPAQKHTQNS